MQPALAWIGRTYGGARVSASDDQADVEKVLAGDVDAFENIVRRWQSPLINLAYRFCRDRGRAEDLARRRSYGPTGLSANGERTPPFRPGCSRSPPTCIGRSCGESRLGSYPLTMCRNRRIRARRTGAWRRKIGAALSGALFSRFRRSTGKLS